MGRVLGIVSRTLATRIIHKAGFTKSTAHTGAVTLIQRIGSALNLNGGFKKWQTLKVLPGAWVPSTLIAAISK
jgi:hypothetical protein